MVLLSENGILLALVASVFTFLMTTVGASTVFLSSKLSPRILESLSGFSAGIMLGASFFSLLLPATGYVAPMPVFIPVTVGFLLGAGFVFSGGFLPVSGEEQDRSAVLLFTAVTLHNIPEGLAVGIACGAVFSSPEALAPALLLTLGVGIENIPEGACVAYPLKTFSRTDRACFLFSVLSGAVEIPAALLGALISLFVNGVMPWALSFSAGAMVFVVCFELLPELTAHKNFSSVGFVAGFCLITLLDLALGG